MNDQINADLAVRAMAHTAQMEWAPSPSGTVWRKRVHLVGAPESGQVTSLVRYEPRSTFPSHDHPRGEEILVLDGVFSDEHGDWPAGTYLLNPEGFRHAPFSAPGCLLFVKLRQFPGRSRQHVAIDTGALEWERTSVAGIAHKQLYKQRGFSDETHLERWMAGTQPGVITYRHGVELFVIDGGFSDEHGRFEKGSWLRMPAGSSHRPRSESGCTLYVKTAGLAYLESVTG